MIRKPWQIWLAFLLCLAVVVPAMAWLSFQTIKLDQLRETDRVESELARQEAELQERISSALYRMDLKMLPLIAQEASRPHYSYKPFYKVANPGIGNTIVQTDAEGMADVSGIEDDRSNTYSILPSPLLYLPPEFVLLHFQLDPDHGIFSPQRPVGANSDIARLNFGITQSQIDTNEKRLREATTNFDYEKILNDCPQVKLPQFAAQTDLNQKPQSVYSVPAMDKFQKVLQDKLNNLDPASLSPQLTNKAQVQRTRGAERVNAEFNRRLDSTKQFAGQQWQSQNAYDNQLANVNRPTNQPKKSVVAREGVMQPLWVEENLILARRVDGLAGTESSIVQVCWLDWTAIQSALKNEVADLLPNVKFEPIRKDSDLKAGTALTTIPVQLVVDNTNLLSKLALSSSLDSQTSGLRLSLWVAWIGLALATIATGLLLYGVMRLSERRATFVSAVTHELRTPLTTFRMYAEMLAEKMVPEGKQQEYANTLRVQADRLSHLVENVLQFARLERGSDKVQLETITIEELFSRFSSRLTERADEGGMDLVISIPKELDGLKIRTQASTIEQVLFNLVDNACKYAKPTTDRQIIASVEHASDKVQFKVQDHGLGVAPEQRKRMFKPFCKSDLEAANTASGVGLGLALCRRMAASLGGRLYFEPNEMPKTGSTFVLEIPNSKELR